MNKTITSALLLFFVSQPNAFSAEALDNANARMEVLYGLEVTQEELIITVATGGCTKKDDFSIVVNKGYTGVIPYLVTVYRVVPDRCKMLSNPIKIPFTREELDLGGVIEFTVRNKLGNTSNHRL